MRIQLGIFSAFNYQFMVSKHIHLISQYRNNMEIKNIDFTSILSITEKNELVSRSKMFLDTLAEVYINYTIERQIRQNENTIEYIDKQLEELKKILDVYETEMETYKRDKSILDLNKEEEEYFNSLVKFEGDKKKLELGLESIASLKRYLLNNSDDNLIPPSVYILEDVFLQSSLNELYEIQLQRNRNLQDITPESESYRRSQQAIDSLRSDILLYIDNTDLAIKDNIRGIGKHINEYAARIRLIPASERDILHIDRKLKANEQMYLFLLEKRASAVIAKAGIVPQTSIIERSKSIGIVEPNKKRLTLIFVGTGFVFSLVLAFFRFLFYERIENVP